jgi:hypothetical protein
MKAQEIVIDGIEYVSSKEAARISGYSHDYIGQLARSGGVSAKRVAGLWYVSKESIVSDTKQVGKTQISNHDSSVGSISHGGINYISANRASILTDYNQDYIGQLARARKVVAKQFSRRWYISEESILRHKAEKDEEATRIQVSSVGLSRSQDMVAENLKKSPDIVSESQFKYYSENVSLMPMATSPETRLPEQVEKDISSSNSRIVSSYPTDEVTVEYTHVPIKVRSAYSPIVKSSAVVNPSVYLHQSKSTLSNFSKSCSLKYLPFMFLGITLLIFIYLSASFHIVTFSEHFIFRDLYYSR